MRAYERFLKYVAIPTQSSETSGTHPSSSAQFDLADLLEGELRAMGLSGIIRDEHCYVYAYLPATAGYEKAPRLGFIAHIDTSPDFSGSNLKPVITENYNGGDLPLGTSGRVLKVSDFPHLAALKGRTLITTDGTTLLGADDKAGVAEIMTLLEQLIAGKNPHGKISVCFTPDEEIGAGADLFDLKRFDADFAYTVDGSAENCIEYENFNAYGAKVNFTGVNVHPGDAKNIMVNALLIAAEFNASLPADEIPARTADYEGFYHLTHCEGNVEKAELDYIIRDHDATKMEQRLNTLKSITAGINKKLGYPAAVLTLKEQYRNMAEKIAPCMHLIENAKAACVEAGASPIVAPIRGGTDGARLSYMGLPCPNLGTGGYGYHGPFEHITAEGMDIAAEILVNIVRRYAAK